MRISEMLAAKFLRKIFTRNPSDQVLIRKIATAIDGLPNPSNRDSVVKLTEEMIAAGEIPLAIDCLRIEYEERDLDSIALKVLIQGLVEKHLTALGKLFQSKYEGFRDA